MKNKTKLFLSFFILIAFCAGILSVCTEKMAGVSKEYSLSMKRFVDAPKGYSISVPTDMTFDFSLAKSYTKCMNSNMEFFMSKEKSFYEDVVYYINYYYDRFIVSPVYQEKNNMKLNCNTIEKIKDKRVKILSVTRNPYKGSKVKFNTYTYVYILKDGDRSFFRLMIKSTAFDKSLILRLVESFKEVEIKGEPTNTIDMKPIPLNWNSETKQFYDNLCNRKDVMWGIFIPGAVSPNGLNTSIATLESRLDYKFGLCMQYSHFPYELPSLKGWQDAYADGKITELSLQTATLWNNDIDKSVNPNFEIIDGVRDEEIRAYARAVKEFKHPIIIRLNNEMNTDWTSYCGVQLLGDPEIFREVFKRIFDIFKQEGVDNAIWVFNPQYLDYPSANFNNFMSYFPGNDKVQVLGVSAYNGGTYYKETDGSYWRSFQDMYDGIQALYSKDFAAWPWIIGEFATDSHGGSKENWMTNMFNKIGDYKNIKGAIWLNWEAYDSRKGSFGTLAHCYRLEETDATLRAFKEGVHGTQTHEILNER